jgi:hypothetical protein
MVICGEDINEKEKNYTILIHNIREIFTDVFDLDSTISTLL